MRFEGNYLQWLWQEIKQGTNGPALAIWFFGFGFQLSIYLASPITLLSTVTLIATLVGLLCTTLMMSGSPANGVVGLISVIGFVWVNWAAGHWWSVLDQLIFALAIDIPLMISWRTWGQNFDQKVRKLDNKGWLITGLAIIFSWVVLYFVAIYLKDTSPFWDSLVLSIGAIASVLCYKHYANTYTLWLLEDIVNVGLWFSALSAGYSQSSLPMLVSVLMYLATAIYGKFFSVWKHAMEV